MTEGDITCEASGAPGFNVYPDLFCSLKQLTVQKP